MYYTILHMYALYCTCTLYILEPTCSELREAVIGIIVCRMGTPVNLGKSHDNHFVHNMDPYIVDNATNHVVYKGQKPLGLFSDLIQLYSAEDEWVLYAPSGIGKYLYLPYTIPRALSLMYAYVHIVAS